MDIRTRDKGKRVSDASTGFDASRTKAGRQRGQTLTGSRVRVQSRPRTHVLDVKVDRSTSPLVVARRERGERRTDQERREEKGRRGQSALLAEKGSNDGRGRFQLHVSLSFTARFAETRSRPLLEFPTPFRSIVALSVSSVRVTRRIPTTYCGADRCRTPLADLRDVGAGRDSEQRRSRNASRGDEL